MPTERLHRQAECGNPLLPCVQSASARSYPIMGPVMADESGELQDQLRRLAAGDQQALAELFARYRDRLRRFRIGM